MDYPITRAIAPSCGECGLRDQCGGLPGEGYEKGCFERCTKWCADHGCDMACPTNAMAFSEMVAEIEGLNTLPRKRVLGFDATKLPIYAPQINHGGGRTGSLREALVCLPLYELIAQDRKGRVRVIYGSPEEVRRSFQLSADTSFVITSVGYDRHLEAFWADHRARNLLGAIAALQPLAMTVPNFSFMIDVPRTNDLYNFGRMFRLSERMTAAGIATIFHLNAVTAFDWNCWKDVLNGQPASHVVSLEFQTGAARRQFGDAYFSQMVALQDALGRPLHPLMLAGGGRLKQLDACFNSFTVVDATPFIKTMNRQVLAKRGTKWKWRFEPTAAGASLSARLASNIGKHRFRFHERLGLCAASDGQQQQRLLLPPAGELGEFVARVRTPAGGVRDTCEQLIQHDFLP